MPALQSFVGFALALTGILSLSAQQTAPETAVEAPEPPPAAPRAARSVHLGWRTGAATAFSTEITVRETVPGSYFCAIGFHRGYGGIQDLGDGRHVAIFSAWDAPDDTNRSDHERDTREHLRTEVLALHPDAPQARFSGEGTGARCLYPFAWEPGKPVRLLLQGRQIAGERAEYRAWIRNGADGQWALMGVYRTQRDPGPMQGFYSFVEDFRRDGETPRQRRLAEYGPTWVERDGQWQVVESARFTADGTPLENVDSGPTAGGRLRLATGGDFAQDHAKLWEQVKVEQAVSPSAEEVEAMNALLASPWAGGAGE